MVEVQDFDFTVQYAPGSTLVVPDTLSRDAFDKPSCQRYFAPVELHQEGNSRTEEVGAVVAIGPLRRGTTIEQFIVDQVGTFGDPV